MTEALDLDPVRTRVERYRLDWVAERTALARSLARGEPMPDGYWQAERRARGLYDSSRRLLDALDVHRVHNDG